MPTGSGKASESVNFGKNLLVTNVVGEALDGLEDLLFGAHGGSLPEDGEWGKNVNRVHERGGNIPARMVRDRGAASVRVTVLQMRAALPHEGKAEVFQQAADFPRFEDRELRHGFKRP